MQQAFGKANHVAYVLQHLRRLPCQLMYSCCVSLPWRSGGRHAGVTVILRYLSEGSLPVVCAKLNNQMPVEIAAPSHVIVDLTLARRRSSRRARRTLSA